jgi:hypothetical protein
VIVGFCFPVRALQAGSGSAELGHFWGILRLPGGTDVDATVLVFWLFVVPHSAVVSGE